jgi:hypothetical protein
MRKRIPTSVVMVGVLFVAAPASPQYGALQPKIRQQCLSDHDLDTIRQLKALKRAMLASETPWAAAGPEKATVTFKYVNNCYYEGQVQGTGADGKKYTAKIQLLYRAANKHLSWIETDSRGFTVVREGDITGHGPTSQQFDYVWEAIPFTFKGKTVTMVGSMFITAPTYLRQDIVMILDDAVQRVGAPQWERQQPEPPK